MTVKQSRAAISRFDEGVFIGVVVGEGSFGGDGKQPQLTLRMHTRHEALFMWLMARFPNSKLYGPYHHGGRSYYQWMARGPVLVEEVMPLLDTGLTPELDGYAYQRYCDMQESYKEYIATIRSRGSR